MQLFAREQDMKYDVNTSFPDGVKGFRYMGNSHYIELVDKQGRSAKINATGLVRYDCSKCESVFFMTSNFGNMTCPSCRTLGSSHPMWVVPQLSFVPEETSDLQAGFDHEPKDV